MSPNASPNRLTDANPPCKLSRKLKGWVMRNTAVGISGLVLVLLGLVATVCLFAFEQGLRKLDWIDLEAATLGSAVICLTGCVLG